MHTYERGGSYPEFGPLMVGNRQYGLDKPNVVGEFSESGGDGRDITELYNWAYYRGYSGRHSRNSGLVFWMETDCIKYGTHV